MASSRSHADRVLRIGAWITVVGLACTAIAMVPLVATGVQLPAWWWFLSMLVAVGLCTVFAGLIMANRARSRMVGDVVDQHPSS